MHPTLESEGFLLLPGAVAPDAVRAVLRMLNLSIRRHGLSPEEIIACQPATFFPHLRWQPEVWGVLPPAAAELLGWAPGDDWAEPQLLLRLPDEEQTLPLRPHLDSAPPWAAGRHYRGIVGVALTAVGPDEGALHVWRRWHRNDGPSAPEPVPMAAGDAVLLHPQLKHCGSLNLGPHIRYAIYFRLLARNPHAQAVTPTAATPG